jgi:hypothetical protein
MDTRLSFEAWHYYLTLYVNRLNINVEHLDAWQEEYDNGINAFEALSIEYPEETKNFPFVESDYHIAIWEQTMGYNRLFQQVKRKHHIVLKSDTVGICSKATDIQFVFESNDNHGFYYFENILELDIWRKTTNDLGFAFCSKCLKKIDKLKK